MITALAVPGYAVEVCETPRRNARRHDPTLVVLHWTATGRPRVADRSRMCSWLRRQDKSGSTHVVVCRDGHIIQAADPHRHITWHAGQSAWPGCTTGRSVNALSVGVDLEHSGRPDEGISQAQAAALLSLLSALGAAVPTLREVVRHCDVSPGRKIDTADLVDLDFCRAAMHDGREDGPKRWILPLTWPRVVP
jgi:N-acetyl-anhydromuramyl-L-alanine amidase AmpD